ncbi:beta-1,4-mannosyl-glycoprotein 4-beta-N-acetylglucosaminyltransferase-like [Ornithodoros turicata]|uniref:beta-1,4-mannosyl-glycoprotein 4-beta-N-acetylglucosaminyltransferase-like n=1 Tax=Ornithodoros turicata TaxID=34597 RepID=UPI0031387B17
MTLRRLYNTLVPVLFICFLLPLFFLPQQRYGVKFSFFNPVAVVSSNRTPKPQHELLYPATAVKPNETELEFSSPGTSYPFEAYDPTRPPVFELKDNTPNYFINIASTTCFKLGTNASVSQPEKCVCLPRWYGKDCSQPQSIVASDQFQNRSSRDKITRRRRARRVINGININHELDMLEIRLNELYNVVDVFIVCESNYTAYGDAKPLYLLPKLKAGFLRQFQDKIVYVWLDHFPEGGTEDGWIADGYLRTFLWKQGKTQLSGLRDDDIFILNDADEIPQADAIAFLKTHDGYGFPIALRLQWTSYGFYWLATLKYTNVTSICTVKYLEKVLQDDAYGIRKVPPYEAEDLYGEEVERWIIGMGNETHGGWHCSNCLPIPLIKVKMLSAQSADGPRWGDYPDKMNESYILYLVNEGRTFDDQKCGIRIVVDESTAPAFVLRNRERFRYLIEPPGNRTVKETRR